MHHHTNEMQKCRMNHHNRRMFISVIVDICDYMIPDTPKTIHRHVLMIVPFLELQGYGLLH